MTVPRQELSLLGPDVAVDSRKRLTMISADDASVRPLSAKLLERPALLKRILRAIGDIERCHLVPYVSTELEPACAPSARGCGRSCSSSTPASPARATR